MAVGPLAFYGGDKREAATAEVLLREVGVQNLRTSNPQHRAAGDDFLVMICQLLAISGERQQQKANC